MAIILQRFICDTKNQNRTETDETKGNDQTEYKSKTKHLKKKI